MKDEEIIERLRDGDKQAYKELFIRYYSPLCEFASHYVQDNEAEELVENLMLYLWEAHEYLLIERSLKSYLFGAVRNRCLNMIRQNLCHTKIRERLYDRFKDRFEDPDFYLYDELFKQINRVINELPNHYRETFQMSRFGELSNKEIAQKLGVSIKTVEYRITQSLKILRVELKDWLD